MKKWVKLTILSLGGLIGLSTILVGGFIYWIVTQNDRDNKDPAKQEEMARITQEWARLAPFPKEITNYNIYTEGSMFTRTFKGSFIASGDTIQEWVKKSPGLQDAKIETISERKKKYIISPGGGAAFAQVVIDYETGKIEFKVHWS